MSIIHQNKNTTAPHRGCPKSL